MAKKKVRSKPIIKRKVIDPSEVVPFDFETRPATADQDRMTARLTVHHEHYGDNPTTAEVAFSRMLEYKIQPYGPRRLTITNKPTKLDLSFFEEPEQVGYIVIENRTGKGLLRNPTPEEKEDMEKLVVLIDGFEVAPREAFIGKPLDASKVVLRAVDQPVEINLTIYPR